MSDEKFKGVYIFGPPTYVGKIPLRTDVTVLPADDPDQKPIGFSVNMRDGDPCAGEARHAMNDFRAPLTDDEINELLGLTLHGPLPMATLLRVMATLAEVPALRAQVATLLKQSYEDAAFGDS